MRYGPGIKLGLTKPDLGTDKAPETTCFSNKEVDAISHIYTFTEYINVNFLQEPNASSRVTPTLG